MRGIGLVLLVAWMSLSSGCGRSDRTRHCGKFSAPSSNPERIQPASGSDDLIPAADKPASPPPAPQPELKPELLSALEDQNQDPFPGGLSAVSVLLVLGGTKVSRPTQAWADELERNLGEAANVIRVLDLKNVPGVGGAMVRAGIRRQVGEKPIRVYLDWKGALCDFYSAPRDIPSVIAFGADHEYAGRAEGELTEDSLISILKGLDRPPTPRDPQSR